MIGIEGNRIVTGLVEGNCLAPELLPGDLLVMTSNCVPRNGDIVVVLQREGAPLFMRFAKRYRVDGQKIWLESRDGKMPLSNCIILGVVILVAQGVMK